MYSVAPAQTVLRCCEGDWFGGPSSGLVAPAVDGLWALARRTKQELS